MSFYVDLMQRRRSLPTLKLDRIFFFCLGAITIARPGGSHLFAARDAAVSILKSSESDLDEREWAERYLCGMCGADKGAFMKGRRIQS